MHQRDRDLRRRKPVVFIAALTVFTTVTTSVTEDRLGGKRIFAMTNKQATCRQRSYLERLAMKLFLFSLLSVLLFAYVSAET